MGILLNRLPIELNCKGYIVHSDANQFMFYSINPNGSKNLWSFSYATNKVTLDATYSNDTFFLRDETNNSLFIVTTDDGMVCFKSFSGSINRFMLSEKGEFVVEICLVDGNSILKTAQDTESEQITRLYLIDLSQNSIIRINDKLMTSSYSIPRCIKSADSTIVIIEESGWNPPECSNCNSMDTDASHQNKILYISKKDLVSERHEQSINIFRELNIGRIDANSYVQILDIICDTVFVTCVNQSANTTYVRRVNPIFNTCETQAKIPCVLSGCLSRDNKLCGFYSWSDGYISIYTPNGNHIGDVRYENYFKKNPSLEISDILGLWKERYVVFSVVDYIDEDDVRQVRLVYDLNENVFSMCSSSFIVLGSEVF